jgi:hypothetical protein
VNNLIVTLNPHNFTGPEMTTYLMLDEAQEQALVNSLLQSLRQDGLSFSVGMPNVVIATVPGDFTNANEIDFANQLVALSSQYPQLAEYATMYGDALAYELPPVRAFWDQSVPVPASSPLLSKVLRNMTVAVSNSNELCFLAYDNMGILSPALNTNPVKADISFCPGSMPNPVYLLTGSQYNSPYNPRYIAGPGQKIVVIVTGFNSYANSLPTEPTLSLNFQGTYSFYQGAVKIEACGGPAPIGPASYLGICAHFGILPSSISLYQQCSLVAVSCAPAYEAEIPITSQG